MASGVSRAIRPSIVGIISMRDAFISSAKTTLDMKIVDTRER